jgi:hypothetical protein
MSLRVVAVVEECLLLMIVVVARSTNGWTCAAPLTFRETAHPGYSGVIKAPTDRPSHDWARLSNRAHARQEIRQWSIGPTCIAH